MILYTLEKYILNGNSLSCSQILWISGSVCGIYEVSKKLGGIGKKHDTIKQIQALHSWNG